VFVCIFVIPVRIFLTEWLFVVDFPEIPRGMPACWRSLLREAGGEKVNVLLMYQTSRIVVNDDSIHGFRDHLQIIRSKSETKRNGFPSCLTSKSVPQSETIYPLQKRFSV
jgi:hypothetical protein